MLRHEEEIKLQGKVWLRAVKSWWFSLALLVGYLITFQLWRIFPDRAAFLVVGALAVVSMTVGMKWAAWRGYFVDRSDLMLHGLVILDVALEGVSYELFEVASRCILCVPGDASTFHNTFNFCWCATILGALVGGYHWSALRKARGTQLPAGSGDRVPPSPSETASV